MKKQIVIWIAAALSALCLAFALAGCKAGDSKEHVHNYGELIPEISATCSKSGVKAHYHCVDCGKDFDAEKNERTSDELKIPPDPQAHDYGELIYERPTETTSGKRTHYRCSRCRKYFDSEKNETQLKDLIIPAGHFNTDHVADEEGVKCTVCGERLAESLTFELNADGYILTKGVPTSEGKIIIPKTYNNLPVTKIGGNAFAFQKNLKSIILPAGVTEIGGNAFYGCSNLTGITLPKDLISLGESVFSGCAKLANITIPASVTFIGRYAFKGCESLAKVSFENAEGWQAYREEGVDGINLKLTVPSQNASYLKDSYSDYGWKRI